MKFNSDIMKERLNSEAIIKEETVFYLKSKINLQTGILFITPSRIILQAHKTKEEGLGFLNFLFKRQNGNDKIIFDIEYTNIQSITERKLSLQNNIMEIMDKHRNMYCVLVKNYKEWEDFLTKKLKSAA